jgi:hypothetical protein
VIDVYDPDALERLGAYGAAGGSARPGFWSPIELST